MVGSRSGLRMQSPRLRTFLCLCCGTWCLLCTDPKEPVLRYPPSCYLLLITLIRNIHGFDPKFHASRHRRKCWQCEAS